MCLTVYVQVCLCASVHLSCVGVWQTEWDLSAEGAGETINTAHQGVRLQPSLVMRGEGGCCRVWLRESQGSMDTHSQRPPDAGLCCLFYDTWQDNESVAPLKISPMGVLSFCIFSLEEYSFSRFTVKNVTRCLFKGTSILDVMSKTKRGYLWICSTN